MEDSSRLTRTLRQVFGLFLTIRAYRMYNFVMNIVMKSNNEVSDADTHHLEMIEDGKESERSYNYLQELSLLAKI